VNARDESCVLLFDGRCPLCDGAARFLLRRRARRPFRAIPFQSPRAAALLSSHAGVADPERSIVVIERGEVLLRSDALLRIARRLAFPWNLVAVGTLLPRPLRDSLYDLVANRRYALFGRLDTCSPWYREEDDGGLDK
jgi:predicted DCC family thiol-disulfide oxidoreductase YuxK